MIPRAHPEASRVSVAGLVAVVIGSCLPYVSTIRDYFTEDDFGVVMLFARKPWTTFPRWFTMPWTEDIWGYTPDEIRPFPALSYQITALWGAAAPEAHHVLNVALHAGNALLVLAIARSVAGLSPIAAGFAAIVFAILPVQAESVAWITGRVDSMPAFFYLATFLAYARWRMSGGTSTRAFIWTLVLFFLVLFSKQNTITMVATLVFYDWLIADRPLRLSWPWLRPYVPFALMTAGFLALRYAVVGTVVREGTLNAEGFRYFVELFGRHLRRVVLARAAAPSWIGWSLCGVLTASIGLSAMLPDAGTGRRRIARLALFFGPLWWLIGVAPTAVAGYESPRHVYLASVAWAMLLGLGFDVAERAWSGRGWRYAVRLCAIAVVAAYAVQLRVAVREWNSAAAISKKGVARVQREALATPPGSLLIVGAPLKSWEWSVPFNFQPPYTETDLTQRVYIISPWRLHCCRSLWADYTRRTLRAWVARTDHTPIVVLYASARTGAISRLTDREYPALRALIPVLLTMESREAMDKALLDILERLAGNGA